MADQTQQSLDVLLEQIERGKFSDVARALATGDFRDADAVRARAELALRGGGPSYDVALWALLTGDESWWAAARRIFGASEALECALAELEARSRATTEHPSTPSAPTAPDATGRLRERGRAAARARAGFEFENAAGLLDDPDLSGSAADHAPSIRLHAALDAWAAGQGGPALEKLTEYAAASPVADAWVTVLRRAGTPSWQRCEVPAGRATRTDGASVLEIYGLEVPAADVRLGMAELADQLRRQGAVTLRCALERETLAKVAASGALVVLEEERSVGTGFRLLLGYDRAGELLACRDPHQEEAELVPFVEQERRSALVGGSVLVVCGRGDAGQKRREALEAEGVRDDELLCAYDRTLVDEHGERPTSDAALARLRVLAEKFPRSPHPRLRMGELLLGELAAKNIEVDQFTSWYAEVAEQFPGLEVPSQLYARYLENTDHDVEAAIAWNTAYQRDPRDARNAMGYGRGLQRLGRGSEALQHFRRAALLDSDSTYLYRWLAACHLMRGEHAAAEVCARIECHLYPDEQNPTQLLVDALEPQGLLDEAEAVLDDAWADHERGEDGVRLLRLRSLRGDFGEAASLARAIGKSEDSVKLEAALALLADGDDADAWGIAEPVLARTDVPRWGELVGRAATTLATEEVAMQRLAQANATMKGEITLLCDLAIWLAARGQWRAAQATCDRLAERWPTDPNTPWTRVRCSLYGNRTEEDAAELVAPMNTLCTELAPEFPPVRAVAAALALARSAEEALALATYPSFAADARSWPVQAAALRALDQPDRAAALEARMRDAGPEVAGRVLSFYRGYRFFDLARAAAESQAQPEDHPMLAYECVMLARDLGTAGPAHERAQRVEGRWKNLPYPTLANLALQAGDAAALEEQSNLAIAYFHASSSREGDAWRYRAFLAAIELQRGDAAPRRELREAAPRHPWALAALTHAERALGLSDAAAEDGAALAALCPYTHRGLLEEETRA